MRWPTLGIVLAWSIATACTGDGTATLDSRADAPPGTADALIELPPAPVLGNDQRATPTTASELALGAWDWGAPCRVGVHEVIGSVRPRVLRTFTIDVAADPSGLGFVMSFDDISEQVDGLSEEFVAGSLYRNLAVLAPMRLDPDGQFVAFVDLDADLAELTARADVGAAREVAAILARQPVVAETILDRTVLGWYGFWLEHTNLPVNPARLAGEGTRHGPAGTWRWSTETFAAPVVGRRRDQVPDGAVWLIHSERPVGVTAGRIDASAIIDPIDRRPSYVVVEIDGFTSGGLAVFAEQDRRIVTFDWENAEGCE